MNSPITNSMKQQPAFENMINNLFHLHLSLSPSLNTITNQLVIWNKSPNLPKAVCSFSKRMFAHWRLEKSSVHQEQSRIL